MSEVENKVREMLENSKFKEQVEKLGFWLEKGIPSSAIYNVRLDKVRRGNELVEGYTRITMTKSAVDEFRELSKEEQEEYLDTHGDKNTNEENIFSREGERSIYIWGDRIVTKIEQ